MRFGWAGWVGGSSSSRTQPAASSASPPPFRFPLRNRIAPRAVTTARHRRPRHGKLRVFRFLRRLMTALTVIHLNGPINSGKTTIGLALARALPDARFIDGDDHDAPVDAPFDVQWAIALERLVTQITHARERHLVIAYPIGETEFERLRAARSGRSVESRLACADGLGAQPDRRDVSRRLCVAAVQPDGARYVRCNARCLCGAYRATRRGDGVVTGTSARTLHAGTRIPRSSRRKTASPAKIGKRLLSRHFLLASSSIGLSAFTESRLQALKIPQFPASLFQPSSLICFLYFGVNPAGNRSRFNDQAPE